MARLPYEELEVGCLRGQSNKVAWVTNKGLHVGGNLATLYLTKLKTKDDSSL